MIDITVTLTERAAKRINRILSDAPGKTALRLAVDGGGCSGFSYKFEMAQEAEADDVAIERDGATLLIDPVSLPYLQGSEVDFVDELMGQHFQVRNPQATASCGCGTSFSI